MNELDKAQPDMRLEVVLLGTSNVDRMKSFFEKLGWRLDIDIKIGDFRGVQLTPHNSEASIILGNSIATAAAQLLLAVNDIDAARNDLLARGVDVSEVFHFAAGPFNTTVPNPRVAGRDPENRPYFTFVSFEDPDGNNWFVQEIKMRLPGREWKKTAQAGDVAALADLLRETGEHHDVFEKAHGEHHWWDWYAPYLNARQNGSGADEAAVAADRHMEKLLVPAR